jgi:hypothetical protein
VWEKGKLHIVIISCFRWAKMCKCTCEQMNVEWYSILVFDKIEKSCNCIVYMYVKSADFAVKVKTDKE